MPLVESSTFRPTWYFSQGDIQTILPRFFRPPSLFEANRKRITTPDQDFLDLDWCTRGSRRLAILTHGLEGSSRSPYMVATAQSLSQRGYDVVSWNFRGCSGEPSIDKRGYHSGKWDDLKLVVDYCCEQRDYDEVYLVGFSVGANITLLYLGCSGSSVPSKISAAALFCAPVDLGSSAREMGRVRNIPYMRWFLGHLKKKLELQGLLKKGTLEHKNFNQLKNFYDFDSRYTAPLFNFASAEAYWDAASSIHVLSEVRRPCLLVNPINDPMLAKQCYPAEICRMSDHVHLETPKSGGHVGFLEKSLKEEPWIGQRTATFFSAVSGAPIPTYSN